MPSRRQPASTPGAGATPRRRGVRRSEARLASQHSLSAVAPTQPAMRDPAPLRSDRSPRRPDLADAPRRDTRPALGAPLDAMSGPGGPAAARALECLLGGERATRRGEPSRDVETRGWGPPWEY